MKMNPSSPAIDIQGFLFKCESSDGFERWHRRWASLCDYCLYLYDKHGDRESRDAFLLPSASVERCDNSQEGQQTIKIVEPGGKVVYLAAANSVEFEEWFNALSAAAHFQRVKRPDMELAITRNDTNNNAGLESEMDLSLRRQKFPKRVNGREADYPPANDLAFMHYSPQDTIPREEPYRMSVDPYGSRNRPPNERGVDSGAVAHEISPDDQMQPYTGYLAGPSDRPDGQMYQPNPYAPSGADGIVPTRAQGLRSNPKPNLNHWPSGKLGIETVKEDPSMLDSEVLATKPLEEIKRKYPVSGLAKRMSIAASDLLGKSHDELVLSLIQLNREKSNLERIRDYYILVLNHLRTEEETNSLVAQDPIHEEKIRRAMNELNDVDHQIELSLPLITFIDNIVKMGALYAGDDVMFATEYRKNLLSPQEYSPIKKNITFARRFQEMQIARNLSADAPLSSERPPSGSGVYDMPTEGYHMTGAESASYRKTREALEQELNELQSIYTAFHGKRSELSAYMKGLPATGGFLNEADTTSSTLQRRQRRKSGGDLETMKDNRVKRDNTIKYPRRSTSRQPRSDTTNSLRRRSVSSVGMNDAMKRNYTLPRNFELRRQHPDLQRSSTLPLANESSMAAMLPNDRMNSRPQANHHGQIGPSGRATFPDSRGYDQYMDGSASLDRRHPSDRRDPRECISDSWDNSPLSDTITPRVAQGQFSAAPVHDQRPRQQEAGDGKKLSVQQQLDLLIGDPRQFGEPARSSASEQPQKPLVRLTAAHYKNGPSAVTRLSASTTDSRERALDRLGRYYESRHGLEPGSMVVVRANAHTRPDEDEDDGGYERLSSVVSNQRRLSEDQSLPNREINESPVVPLTSQRDKRLPTRWPENHSGDRGKVSTRNHDFVHDVRSRRPEDSEQIKQYYQDNDADDSNAFDSSTIDKALWTPSKVVIPDRYDPPSDSESDLLDEVQRREKVDRISSIQRMLAAHSLQAWTDTEIGSDHPAGPDSSSISRKEIEEERHRRQQILEMRQNLAIEVKRRSKAAAKERRKNHDVESDHVSIATS